MVSKGRLDDRSIKRRGPTRQPKRRILIVCEGEETERGYFEKLQHEELHECWGPPLRSAIEELPRVAHVPGALGQ